MIDNPEYQLTSPSPSFLQFLRSDDRPPDQDIQRKLNYYCAILKSGSY